MQGLHTSWGLSAWRLPHLLACSHVTPITWWERNEMEAGGGGGLRIKVTASGLSKVHSGPELLSLQILGIPGSAPELRNVAWEISSSIGHGVQCQGDSYERSHQQPDRTTQNMSSRSQIQTRIAPAAKGRAPSCLGWKLFCREKPLFTPGMFSQTQVIGRTCRSNTTLSGSGSSLFPSVHEVRGARRVRGSAAFQNLPLRRAGSGLKCAIPHGRLGQG